MKVYEFGSWDAPVLLLLPGTCCHWRRNFGHVIPLLKELFHVVCISYDGFDDTEDYRPQRIWSSMLEMSA